MGDWIVYYEPRRPSTDRSSRGGRLAYFVTARLQSIEPDTVQPDHFYGLVSDYLEFDRPVPFKEGQDYFESGLRKEDGSTNRGAFGRAVRTMPDGEYDLTLQAGFSTIIGSDEAEIPSLPGLAEEPTPFERPMVERLVTRPFRDAAFAQAVKSAYADTCAITGLKIINGGGRAEVQAAHIRPVADSGPDSVRNGLALSGTIHWMFDRGLLSMDENFTILKAKDRLPDTIDRLMNPDGKLRLPPRLDLHPYPQYMECHRETVFKG